ncbi:hypothetical protein [Leptolyngbya sp. O-77]|uniref:hypothetical protein n=1 Tax=Leptolyngbya sp. O-77 TaxID=1080068 RepID=UPI0012E38984|nr:hypothetical protein [Leptolyngbya sp. O-77]
MSIWGFLQETSGVGNPEMLAAQGREALMTGRPTMDAALRQPVLSRGQALVGAGTPASAVSD